MMSAVGEMISRLACGGVLVSELVANVSHCCLSCFGRTVGILVLECRGWHG